MPLLRRTRATLRRAELGFFGVVVYTRTHTPRFWGEFCSAGESVFERRALRPWRTSWLIVGICPQSNSYRAHTRTPGVRGGGRLAIDYTVSSKERIKFAVCVPQESRRRSTPWRRARRDRW